MKSFNLADTTFPLRDSPTIISEHAILSHTWYKKGENEEMDRTEIIFEALGQKPFQELSKEPA
jgi:hypothetical protein